MAGRSLADYHKRQRDRYGDRYNPTGLTAKFARYFESGERIKVRSCGQIITGTVGATTGWGPCFLLMRTARSIGSMWTLSDRDEILAVKRGRVYVDV